MSRPFLSALALALLAASATAQEAADPLAGERDLVPGAELALFWVDGPPDGPPQPVQRALLDYVAFGNPALEDSLQLLDRAEASAAVPAGGERAMQVAVADFFGDARADVVQLWEGPDGSIELGLPTTELVEGGPVPQLSWAPSADASFRPAGTLRAFDTATQLRLVAGQFDSDEAPEVVLAYGAEDYSVPIEVHDVAPGGLSQAAELAAADRAVFPANTSDLISTSVRLGLAAGDLDGDGIDEVLVATTQVAPDGTGGCTRSRGCWEVVLSAYGVDGSALTLLDRQRVVGETDGFAEFEDLDQLFDQLRELAVTAGDLDGDGRDDALVGFQNRRGGESFAQWAMQAYRFADGALVPVREQGLAFGQTRGNTSYPLTLQAADLDLDGRDEVVFAGRQIWIVRLDETDGALDVSSGFNVSGGFSETAGSQHVIVADLDGADALWYEASDETATRPEIVAVSLEDFDGPNGVDGRFRLTAFRHDGTGYREAGTRALGVDDWSGGRPVALAAGDFGDRGVRLGAPRYARRTDIAQPLVVLNAPPVHFDVFDGEAFDVAGCYPDATCAFSATYTEQTSQTVEVTTEVVGDWNVGAEVEVGIGNALQTTPTAGGTIGDASSLLTKMTGGISARFAASYGEGFTDLVGSQRTITVTSQVQIFQEDHLYADVVDLDVWEYPLYVRGQFAGYLAIVLPRPETDAWFGTSTPEASTYRPAHEPGHILSYARDLEPRRLSQRVFEGSRYGLGSSAVTWDVTRESTTFQQTEDRTRLRLEGELDLDIPIKAVNLGINLNGDYSLKTFDTHRTSVSDLEAVRVEFGPINASIEGRRATYSVTPFVYWDRSGALVVDYAVEPSVAAPGEEPTWWQERYGQAPDLALNLPDRFRDRKENDPNVSEATKERTRSLAFSSEPAVPGEAITVAAQVHNYSLLPSPAGARVRFYAGDPDEGGVALTGPGAAPDAEIPAMEPRGSATVRADVTLPTGLTDSAVRIYAVVDPEGQVAEIHETNNKGWAPLALGMGTAGGGDSADRRPEARLLANYPNPFRQQTTLAFELSEAGPVRLAVHDVLGREVAVLVDEARAAGRHTVPLDGRGLANGVYVSRLVAGDAQDTRTFLRVD